ncbi:hypothetical protein ACLK19_27920 [Escherichia coli]
MGVMISGLALMGFADSLLTRWRLRKSRLCKMSGVLTGIYTLATGAVANWLAGVVAQQTTESQISGMGLQLTSDSFLRWEWTLACRDHRRIGLCYPFFR